MIQKEKNKITGNNGFTLIELLVVITIMATLTGLFLVNFASLRGPRNLKIAQNEMITNLRKIQSYTLSARDVNDTYAARYYIMRFITGSTSYDVQAVGVHKSAGTLLYFDGSAANKPFIETLKLPTNITINSLSITNASGTVVNPAPNCAQIGFSLPFGKTYIEYNSVSTSCDFSAVISNAATLDAKANHTLTITLKDSASNTTRQVIMRGVTGAIEAK